ncbi:MAG: sugar phosphate isomerase/epimerase family protein [Actinomycetota bacterium]
MKFKISAGIWCLGTYAERYVPGGYFDEISLDQKLEIMSEVEGLDGIGIEYPAGKLTDDPKNLIQRFEEYGLRVGDISVEDYSDRRWKHGALATNEKKVWKENIRLCRQTVDFAREIPDAKVMIWPAHDGFDYPFQVNYEQGWNNMVAAYRQICDYDPEVEIGVEYKSKDPRQRQYISNMGKMMMLFNDIGAENITGCVDTGHALMAQESLAESVALLNSHNKLGIIHLNDNYRDADPDLLFGTLAFWDNLEMYYYLKKIDFSGWHEIDFTSPRDDRIKSIKLVVKMVRKYEQMAEKLMEYSDEIESNLEGYRFADNIDLIADLLF